MNAPKKYINICQGRFSNRQMKKEPKNPFGFLENEIRWGDQV